ncbi:Hypothetical predicted protein [Mytilus galloprovincialis]|uniref:Uncharacterized protein n=1 Tax=Mytilus galloprovincialis TaxID=29158 RepID=A0A8B6DQB4_MYTGA|nr:Hypothetical predicted protein [Mytilus galloprovincialis]
MGKHMCAIAVSVFFMISALALTLISIYFDYWYEVDAVNNSNTTIKNTFSYRYGMWRKCYLYEVPSAEERVRYEKCVYTYEDLIPRKDPEDSDGIRYLHLERSWVGLLITCGAIQIFAVLTMICGLWPCRKNPKRSSIYLASAILFLFAAMAGVASNVCFMALRDLDENKNYIYPAKTEIKYDWTFMTSWIGTGLCFILAFMYICLLCVDYDDVNETGKYSTFSE